MNEGGSKSVNMEVAPIYMTKATHVYLIYTTYILER